MTQHPASASSTKNSVRQNLVGLLRSDVLRMLALALLVAGLYRGIYDDPLVFDSDSAASYFSATQLRSFHDLDFGSRWFTKKFSYWIYLVAGLDNAWQRAADICLHILTTWCFFAFVRRLHAAVDPARSVESVGRLAFFAALVFAAHPVAVYAVAYLGQREIVLATLFSLLTLDCFLRGAVGGNPKWLLASVSCYFIAVFSKEHALMVPAVVLVILVLLRDCPGVSFKRLWWSFALYAAVAGLIVGYMLTELGGVGRVYESNSAAALARARIIGVPLESHSMHVLSVLTQTTLFFRYLAVFVLPLPGWLSIDVQLPFAGDYWSWPYTVSAVAYAAFGVGAAWLLFRSRPSTAIVGFWLLFMWFLFATEFAAVRMHEPFVLYRGYLWILGACVLVSWPATRCAGSLGNVVLITYVFVLISISQERINLFGSELAVWDDAVKKNQPYEEVALAAYRAYSNRGTVLLSEGRAAEALRDFDRSLALVPGFPYGLMNRAVARMQLREMDEALADLTAAIEHGSLLSPEVLARVYGNRAGVLFMTGRTELAYRDVAAALRLDSNMSAYFERQGVELPP